MKNLFLSFVFVAAPFLAHAGQLKCEYNFSGAPMGTVVVGIDDKGVPADVATVSLFYTPARQMPVSNETPAAGQLLRMIISKDDPSNEIHVIVFPPQGNTYKSKLINPSSPMAKELQGACQIQ